MRAWPLIPLGLLGCLAPSARSAPAEVRWLLVQRPYGTVPTLARSGDAIVAPGAAAWVLEPSVEPYHAICPHMPRVVGGRLSAAAVGEIVQADIAFDDAACEHVIEIAPTRPDVQIEGARRRMVGAGQRASVRFTSRAEGVGGIEVRVLSCGER